MPGDRGRSIRMIPAPTQGGASQISCVTTIGGICLNAFMLTPGQARGIPVTAITELNAFFLNLFRSFC